MRKPPRKKKPPPPDSSRVLTGDPLLILTIIGLPLLALLAFTAVIIPVVPILIYLLASLSQTGTVIGRRKKRSPEMSKLKSLIIVHVDRALNKSF